MNIIKNYLYNVTYQIFRMIVPFFTIPYLSKILGPEGIGINSFTSSVIQYFVLIGDLGITMYGSRKIAYVRDNKVALTQTFYEIMILQIITMSISYFIFFIFLSFTHQYKMYYLAQSITIFATAFDISWFYSGIENFKVISVRNFIIKIVFLICIFVFVKSYNDLLLYIILVAMSTLIGNVTLFFNLRKYIHKPKIRDLNIFQHLWPAITLFVPEVAVQIYWVLNKTMLGHIDSVKSSGFFDQSDKTIKLILAVVTATGTVILPHIANSFAHGNKSETRHSLRNSFIFVTSLSIPLAFGISAISSKFVPLFFTNKFLIVSPLLIIESLIIIFIGWSNVIGTQYLVPTNQIKGYTISVILGAVTNILSNIPLIIYFGVIGAVISSDISELSVAIYQLYVIRNQIKISSLFDDLYKYILSGTLMFIVVFIVNKLTSVSWAYIFIEVIIGAIIYLISIYLLHSNIFVIIRNLARRK